MLKTSAGMYLNIFEESAFSDRPLDLFIIFNEANDMRGSMLPDVEEAVMEYLSENTGDIDLYDLESMLELYAPYGVQLIRREVSS